MLEQKSYKLLYAAPKSSDFWITIYMTLCLKPNNALAVEPGAKFWKDIFKKNRFVHNEVPPYLCTFLSS